MRRACIRLTAIVLTLAFTARGAEPSATQSSTGAITGTVVDNAGNPVKGCIVVAQQAAKKMREPLSATTDDKGEFTIENVPEGEYNLKIRTSDARGKATKTINVIAGATANAGKLKLKFK